MIGGGNSAGQAAVFLARTSRLVHILILSGSLDSSMSEYLIHGIETAANIHVHSCTELIDIREDLHLDN